MKKVKVIDPSFTNYDIPKKDMQHYIVKQGKHFYIDRTVLTYPGKVITFAYRKKKYTAEIIDEAYGRDDDVYKLNILEAK